MQHFVVNVIFKTFLDDTYLSTFLEVWLHQQYIWSSHKNRRNTSQHQRPENIDTIEVLQHLQELL